MRLRALLTPGRALLFFAAMSWTAVAQDARTAADGVYTEAQARRGQAIYEAQCQGCHGPTLAGGLAPPLAGDPFLAQWSGRTVADLVDKIQHTMPAASPGTLSRQQAADLVAHMLSRSALAPGTAELAANGALAQMAIAGPGNAAAASPAGAATPSAQASRPPGNMAQMMRGILFPSSNLLFNVQNADPGEQKTGWQPGGPTAFSWVDWGAGIYSGWELVDYAAIAIAESAPLLLLPGRRCENGRPVPVERADWIRFTEDMAEAGRAAYRASQSRNRDAVIEVTNQIADACLQCHEVYRDKPGGTTADPSNKAARCVP